MRQRLSQTSKASIEELVRTRSEDGLRLDGVLIQPFAVEIKSSAIVWAHGLYSAFYHSPGVEIGRALAALGFACVIGNTRGHDFGAAMVRSDGLPLCMGGGWERYADSPRDIAGWISFAMESGFEKVVLVGHSLGARKAAYYQAERQDSRVIGLVVASPGLAFLDPPDRELDEVLARARQMVTEGNGRELVGWPRFGCSMSAATLVECEGSFQRVFFTPDDEPPAVSRVACPMLALYGSEEKTEEKIRISLDTIRQNATSAARLDAAIVEGADHIYTDREAEVARVIGEWSDAL